MDIFINNPTLTYISNCHNYLAFISSSLGHTTYTCWLLAGFITLFRGEESIKLTNDIDLTVENLSYSDSLY